MSPRRDRLVPLAALVGLVLVGALVLVLLTNAVDRGRDALEDAVVGEVDALARSQNSRLSAQVATTRTFLTGRTIDLEVGSAADEQEFADVAELLEDAQLRTGFFLTDADGIVTYGAGLRDPSVLGEPLDRAGFDDALGAMGDAPGEGRWLPVAEGATAEVPTVALALPILDEEGMFRGSFVLESEVAVDSSLNVEISELRRGDTGEYLVYDANGMTIAASNPSLLAAPVPDEGYLTAPVGLQRRDGEVQVFAEVPAAGWRMAFTQDVGEFEQGLTGPLQQAGLVIVAVFLLIGIVGFVALTLRLRAAREEQERLERLAETQEEFISIVSHELRTPVAGVLGFLQTTMDHWDAMSDTERFNALRRSASNARRLQGLTRDVLDSQSAATGRMSFAMAEADLCDEVVVAVEAAAALHPRPNIETVLDTPVVPVLADVDRIQQVLTNLIENAVKVSPPDGTIEVRAWQDGARGLVSVTDQGPGLSPDLRERVFDKFVRGRDTNVAGTGLGLYIARQILEAHGGSISASSGTTGGATFTFEIPVIASAAPAQGNAPVDRPSGRG